jgi:methyl-accepting chemotaxis protein
MKPIYRRLLIFVVAIVVVAGGYLGYRFYAALERSVPPGFSEARSRGAAISEQVILSSNDIAALVARLSSPTSTPAAVSSTLGEITARVTEVRGQAIELTGTLEAMTKSVQDIRLEEARQVALQAVSYRLILVSRLVTYTDEVRRLVVAMRLRLENGTQNSKEISKLIKEINAEVAAVNKVSRLADESMAEFDRLLR